MNAKTRKYVKFASYSVQFEIANIAQVCSCTQYSFPKYLPE